MTGNVLKRIDDEKFYAEGSANFNRAMQKAREESLAPPKQLKISEWADLHGRLSPETSAEPGKFTPFKYQIGIMDAVCDPKIKKVTVRKSARVGFTKVLDMIIGYYLHQDPSPILAVQPRVEDAEDYSKTEIVPMIRDTKVLADIAPDPKSKEGDSTIMKKTFRNGASLALVGANSPGGFRRITVRVAIFDEINGYPKTGAGKEGDQIRLGTKRTLTFWNNKIVVGSTPTIIGESRIDDEYELGDQRHFYVKCPHCGFAQTLEWGGPDLPYGFKWNRDADGNGIPESVIYICKGSACVITEDYKEHMVEGGEWIATKPTLDHASFDIWTAYSLFPNASWVNIVTEWLETKGNPLLRQTFYNLTLGQSYEDYGENVVRADGLLARREIWSGEVPDEVQTITVGVDVQDHRIELEFVGWGAEEESWSLGYKVIDGAFSDGLVRDQLEDYLLYRPQRADGRTLGVSAACIDSGGHHTQSVYEFCKARLGRRVFAIKGESARGGKRSPVWPTTRPVKRKKKAFRPVIIGVNAAKDVIRTRLLLEAHGPGYMHFPMERDAGYFAQLTSEKSVVKILGGFKFRVWELPSGRANEALDCRVYAYAALCSMKQFGLNVGESQKSRKSDHHERPKPLNEGRKEAVSKLGKAQDTQVVLTPEKPIVQEQKLSVTVGATPSPTPESARVQRLRKLA